MKTKIKFIAILILTSVVALYSCKKESKCVAGSGGSLTLTAILQHHGVTIPNQANYPDTVFVKYNTQEYPGGTAANYDTYFVGDSGEDHVHLKNLRCGDYYIFGVGKDTSLHKRVTGGTPYSTSATSGEITIYVPVTE